MSSCPDARARLLGTQALMLNTRWKVFRGDSTRRRDLMFTVVKPSVIQLRGSTKVSVFLASNDAEQPCDFRITGSYDDGACAVSLGDSGYHDEGPDRRLCRRKDGDPRGD